MQLPAMSIWLALLLTALLMAALALILVSTVRQCRWPSVDSLLKLAPIFNMRGGIIMLLTIMWFTSLFLTMAFVIWVLHVGIDPQNAAVVVALAMLTSGAFGGVNGALFKTMTGEEPKTPVGSSSETVVTTQVHTPGGPILPEAQAAHEWMSKNPGKTLADYIAWQSKQEVPAPLQAPEKTAST
jgi:hypothetical protein